MKNWFQMKKTNKRSSYSFVLAFIFLFITSMVSHGQDMELKGRVKALIWLDEGSKNDLQQIIAYLEIKTKQDSLQSELDSLKKKICRDSLKKVDLSTRQDEKQKLLDEYLNVITSEQMTDISVLELHRRICPDSVSDNRYRGILLGERFLADRFNAESREEALDGLKDIDPSIVGTLIRRIEQYESMTNSLRETLEKGNEKKPEVNPERNKSSVERYQKLFFDELDSLNPILLVPDEYPYLYGILMKAIEEKIKDPSNDIKEWIEKL